MVINHYIFLLVSCMEEFLQEEPPGNLTILMSKHLYQQQPQQLVYNYVLLYHCLKKPPNFENFDWKKSHLCAWIKTLLFSENRKSIVCLTKYGHEQLTIGMKCFCDLIKRPSKKWTNSILVRKIIIITIKAWTGQEFDFTKNQLFIFTKRVLRGSSSIDKKLIITIFFG